MEFYSSNCTDVARALCPKQILLSDSVRLSEPVEKRLVFSHHPKLFTQMFLIEHIKYITIIMAIQKLANAVKRAKNINLEFRTSAHTF